jgi:hypothetical protein
MSVDRTREWREAVKAQRTRMGLATPAAEILRPSRIAADAFRTDAATTLQRISVMAAHLLASQPAYALDDGLNGLTEAERDELDADAEAFLKMCTGRIDQLTQAVVAGGGSATGSGSRQEKEHRQAMLQHLTDELRSVARVCDDNRGLRLRRAMEAREGRLGAARAACSSAPAWGGAASAGGGGGGRAVGGAANGCGSSACGDASGLTWAADEFLPEEELDEAEQAELQMENEALRAELEEQVELARRAEASMLEVSNLSHLFATKIEQQSHDIEQLSTDAEHTSENIVMGNRYNYNPAPARSLSYHWTRYVTRACPRALPPALRYKQNSIPPHPPSSPAPSAQVRRLGREALARLPAAHPELPRRRLLLAPLPRLVLRLEGGRGRSRGGLRMSHWPLMLGAGRFRSGTRWHTLLAGYIYFC